MRAFIAIELPPSVTGTMASIQQQLRASSDCPAKWTDPNGMHLTLAFLGNIADIQVQPITAAIAAVCQSLPAFQLRLSGSGAFPGLRRPDVIWIGLKDNNEQLASLHRELWQNLKLLGFAPENRPFHAHLTLARIRESATVPQRAILIETLAKITRNIDSAFTADEVGLMQSKLGPAGPHYSRLADCKLTGR